MKNGGAYNEDIDHIEGTKDLDCIDATAPPTATPYDDGVCSQHGTTGWTSGYLVSALSASTAPNGSEWEWEEWAAECAKENDCDFWTLRLGGNKGKYGCFVYSSTQKHTNAI